MGQAWSNVGTILRSLTKLNEYTPLATGRSDAFKTLGVDSPEYKTLRRTGQPGLATSSPLYKKIVLGIFVLIVLFAIALVLLAVYGDPNNDLIKSAFNDFADGLKVCLGAFVGLIGGKAVTD